MTDLRPKFATLDHVDVPELWAHVESRAEDERWTTSSRPRRPARKLVLAGAMAVMIATILVMGGSLRRTESAYADFQAASEAMNQPNIKFRYVRELRIDDYWSSVSGMAVGQNITQYTEESGNATTDGKGQRTVHEWLIVGDRLFVKQGDGWMPWPIAGIPRSDSSEARCVAGMSDDVRSVFRVSEWLKQCPEMWRFARREILDGRDTKKFEFKAPKVNAAVWIGANDNLVYRFELESSIVAQHSTEWRFFDYGGDFQVEEPA